MDLFSLKCNEVSSSEFRGVFGFGMILGNLAFNAQCCIPVLLENYRGTSFTGTCWLLGGAWFQCRYRDFGERNGNPLQCSCLENPSDGGASWAAVYGVGVGHD